MDDPKARLEQLEAEVQRLHGTLEALAGLLACRSEINADDHGPVGVSWDMARSLSQWERFAFEEAVVALDAHAPAEAGPRAEGFARIANLLRAAKHWSSSRG